MPALVMNFPSLATLALMPLRPTHALADHAALEFGACTCQLEEQAAHGGGGVDVLLIEVEIHAGSLQMLDSAQQIDQGAPHAIDSPRHDHVELSSARIVERGVERWAI